MRLLLVEDDVMVASGIKLGLSDAGYAVDWVGSAERALEVLAQEAFDVAVIDIGLPGINGLELTRRLRTSEVESKAMPVLILTARDSWVEKVEGIEMPNVFAFGRQHDDGRAVVRCAQAPADGQAVFAGHHQVQHDQVHGVAQHDAVQGLAVFGQDDFKTLLSQIAAQQVADTGVVVKNQDLVGTGIGLSLGHDVLVICNRAILRAGNRECLFFYSKALLITIISIESK